MQNAAPLQPDTCLSICSTLESLLLDSVGPNGLHAMVTTSDNTTLISGDGHTIMTSLMMSHPVARWIVGHVRSHHGKTGDNAKSFILMLAEILRQILHGGRGSIASCVQRQIWTEMSSGLSELHLYLADTLLPEIAKYCIVTSISESNRDEVEKICRNLIKTNFAGKFNPRAASHMTDLLCQFVMECCPDLNKLDETVLFLLDHYEEMFIEVTNEVTPSSRLSNGLLISRDFIHKSTNLNSLSSIKYILLQDSFEKLAPETNATFQISNQSKMARVLDFTNNHILGFLKLVKHYGINLIISADSLSEAALHECRKQSISVIHMVPEDEVIFIAQLAKIHIIFGASDIMDDSNVGIASCCDSVVIGNSKYVNLGVAPVKQFLVCSPTKGVCRQWYAALRNALKCLVMWLDEIFDEYSNQSCSKTEEAGASTIDGAASAKDCTDKTEEAVASTIDGAASAKDCTDKTEEQACASTKNDAASAKDCTDKTGEAGASTIDGAASAKDCTDKTEEEAGASTKNEVGSVKDCTGENTNGCLFDAKKGIKTSTILTGVSIQGGGAFEFLIKKILTDLSLQSNISTSMSKACRLIADSIICIPRTLYTNSFVTKTEKSSFLHVQSGIEAHLRNGRGVMGINGRTGKVCDLYEHGVIEPVKVKWLLLCDVVKTAQELLRMDAVVGVKGLLKDL